MKMGKNAGTTLWKHKLLKQVSGYSWGTTGEDDFINWISKETDKNLMKEYFKFAVVRNPFDRIVSAYTHIWRSNRFKPKWFNRDKYTSIDGGDFDKFVQHCMWNKVKDEPSNRHWVPQTWYTHCNGELKMDYLLHTENLCIFNLYIIHSCNLYLS